MLIWNKLLRRFKNVLSYFVLLVVSFLSLILVFSVIYLYNGIENPLLVSFNVFFDMEIDAYLYSFAYGTIIFEKIFKELFIAIFLGKVISQFLDKDNPIFFSKYVTYDERENAFHFRFWIMLPAGQFLYNSTINISLLTQKDVHKAVNRTNSTLNIKPDETNFQQLRGVWEVKVSSQSPSSPREIINELRKNPELKIRVIFKGVSEKGEILHSVNFYTLDCILENCAFVSIRSSTFLPGEKKNFFRYQNFNKVYIPTDKSPEYRQTNTLKEKHGFAQKDILTYEETMKRKYCGVSISSKINDFFSTIFHFKYNPGE